MFSSPASANLQQYPCPSCGASLEFNPRVGKLKCPYCGNESHPPQAQRQVREQDYEQFANRHQTQIAALSSTAQEVQCPGCHASLTFQPPDVADRCPFCGTGIVAQPHAANPVIAPEGILPFQVGQKEARQLIRTWISKLWFAPNQLKQTAQHAGLQGIYLPFWTYDCQTHSDYRGERGTYYYTTETYTETNSQGKTETKTRQVRHTRWTSASGHVSRFFDDVLIPAVRSLNVSRLEQLEPWDLSRVKPYDPSYLAGFKAQRYQVKLEEGLTLAKGKMAPKIRSDVERDIGGDTQRVHSVNTAYRDITFKHLLLPVWLASYRYNNKPYQVMINAQTGEVLGDRPYSVWKITMAVLSAALVIGGFVYLKHEFDRQRSQPPNPASVYPSVPSSAPSPAPIPPTGDPLVQAMRLAANAATQTQTAYTREQWQQVVHQWEQAIGLLQTVPSTHSNYGMAQQKMNEYQTNLNYARQRLNNAP